MSRCNVTEKKNYVRVGIRNQSDSREIKLAASEITRLVDVKRVAP